MIELIAEKGYAKINLGLEVVAKLPDNYHELSMIMTPINLHDDLYFEDISDNVIVIDYGESSGFKIEDDLIYKAYSILKTTYNIGKGLKVKVVKRIPEQAGLGGGSADAAATLRALNQLWDLHLSLDELARLGFVIGCDVPFCIYNKTAKVTGRGDKIEFIEECPHMFVLLVFPDFKSSTAEVFSAFRNHNHNKGKIEKLQLAIKHADISEISNLIFNDLEYTKHYLEINGIKEGLLHCGAIGSVMTGSGSTVYGICHSQKHAKSVLKKYNKLIKNLDSDKNYQAIVSTTKKECNF